MVLSWDDKRNCPFCEGKEKTSRRGHKYFCAHCGVFWVIRDGERVVVKRSSEEE